MNEARAKTELAGDAWGGDRSDSLVLRDHVVEAEIGAFQPERGRSQRIRVDITAEIGAASGLADDVDRVLSYDLLHEAVAAELAAGRVNLLETLAEGIAARILVAPLVRAVDVSVAKLDICPGALGVAIHRRRGAAPAPARPLAAPAEARLVLVPAPGAGQGAGLAPWLAAETAGAPLVLCADAGPSAPPDCPAAVARRIDLLGFEQAAWRLAACDPRFVVTDSRTELDWALRRGRWSVWAPSKMVLDAQAEAPAPPLAMATLAGWLATRLGIAAPEQAQGDHEGGFRLTPLTHAT